MIYLDTSFVVSLYSVDANSAAAAASLQAVPDALVLTALTELETVNALELRVFRKEISVSHAGASLRAFNEDLRRGTFLLRALPEPVFASARRLSFQTTARLGARTADLLHVAAALELGAAGFFSFDGRQRKVAWDAGLLLNPTP